MVIAGARFCEFEFGFDLPVAGRACATKLWSIIGSGPMGKFIAVWDFKIKMTGAGGIVIHIRAVFWDINLIAVHAAAEEFLVNSGCIQNIYFKRFAGALSRYAAILNFYFHSEQARFQRGSGYFACGDV